MKLGEGGSHLLPPHCRGACPGGEQQRGQLCPPTPPFRRDIESKKKGTERLGPNTPDRNRAGGGKLQDVKKPETVLEEGKEETTALV